MIITTTETRTQHSAQGCLIESVTTPHDESVTLSVPLTLADDRPGKVWIMTSNHPVRDTWVWKYFNHGRAR